MNEPECRLLACGLRMCFPIWLSYLTADVCQTLSFKVKVIYMQNTKFSSKIYFTSH